MDNENKSDTTDGHPSLKIQEVELIYKSSIPITERIQITCSTDAYEVFKANWSKQIGILEEFNILFLTNLDINIVE